MFQAITVAAIPGGVPVVWHGAPILKAEMEDLGLGMDDRHQGGGAGVTVSDTLRQASTPGVIHPARMSAFGGKADIAALSQNVR